MANHKSAEKRIRSDEVKRLRNRYLLTTCKSCIKNLKKVSDKSLYEKMLPGVVSKLHKLAKRNIIHANKAANKISKLYIRLNSMVSA